MDNSSNRALFEIAAKIAAFCDKADKGYAALCSPKELPNYLTVTNTVKQKNEK